MNMMEKISILEKLEECWYLDTYFIRYVFLYFLFKKCIQFFVGIQFFTAIFCILFFKKKAFCFSIFDLGQNVQIFHSGSRIYLRMVNHFYLKSCSLQNIKKGDSLLSENRVVFYFRNEMYYLRWRRSSV